MNISGDAKLFITISIQHQFLKAPHGTCLRICKLFTLFCNQNGFVCCTQVQFFITPDYRIVCYIRVRSDINKSLNECWNNVPTPTWIFDFKLQQKKVYVITSNWHVVGLFVAIANFIIFSSLWFLYAKLNELLK